MLKADKPQYRVLELSLIGNELVQPGVEIDNYDGFPAGNLLPLNDLAKAKAAEYQASIPARRAALEAQYGSPESANAKAMADAIGKAVAEALAAQSAEVADLKAQLAAKAPPADPAPLG